MKVIILVPYFGPLPTWMEYFLRSCEKNPSYNWILFSDASKPDRIPANVRFETCSLDEFNKLAGAVMGLKINIQNPYKICDLRPAFGTIFSKYLKDADFWGYSDLDLVYGNLDSFLSPDIFKNFDIISTRKEYLSGHFALYRNTKSVNELFKLSSQYKEIFEHTSKHYAFDERSNVYGRGLPKKQNRELGAFLEYYWNKLKLKAGWGPPGKLLDINSIIRKSENEGQIKVYRKTMVRSDKWYRKQDIKNWQVKWEDGQLIDTGSSESFLHFHFLEEKNRSGFIVESLGSANSFTISPQGFKPE